MEDQIFCPPIGLRNGKFLAPLGLFKLDFADIYPIRAYGIAEQPPDGASMMWGTFRFSLFRGLVGIF